MMTAGTFVGTDARNFCFSGWSHLPIRRAIPQVKKEKRALVEFAEDEDEVAELCARWRAIFAAANQKLPLNEYPVEASP